MRDWERISERKLLQIICDKKDRADKWQATNELQKRLERYFASITKGGKWLLLIREKEDVIAETMMRLSLGYPKFRGNSWQYRKFISKTVISVCAARLWADRHYADQPDDEARFEDMIAWLDTSPREHAVERTVIKQAQHQQQVTLLNETLAELSEEQQQLIMRVYIYGDNHKDIADELNQSHVNIRQRLRRARQELARRFLTKLAATTPMRFPSEVIDKAIGQLPEPKRVLVSAWWRGETSWKKLGLLLKGAYSQTEVKELFAFAMLDLFHILSAGNQFDFGD